MLKKLILNVTATTMDSMRQLSSVVNCTIIVFTVYGMTFCVPILRHSIRRPLSVSLCRLWIVRVQQNIGLGKNKLQFLHTGTGKEWPEVVRRNKQ